MTASRVRIRFDSNGNKIEEAGRASPELLREDLRALPSELLTKDAGDADRIYESDEAHVQQSILRDYATAAAGKTPEAEDKLGAEAVRGGRLTQESVDFVRLRVMRAISTNDLTPGEKLKVSHLWFPRDDVNAYELRMGNPPADSQRPKHLRRLRLEIDLSTGRLPETIVDKLPLNKRLEYRKHLERVQTGYYTRPARSSLLWTPK